MSNQTAMLGRILLGLLFVVAGVRKVMGLGGTIGYIGSKGLPIPEILAYATIALEIIAGLALIFNRFTVPASYVLAAFCIATAVLFHNFWAAAPQAFNGELNNFLKNLALAGGFLVTASHHDSRAA